MSTSREYGYVWVYLSPLENVPDQRTQPVSLPGTHCVKLHMSSISSRRKILFPSYGMLRAPGNYSVYSTIRC